MLYTFKDFKDILTSKVRREGVDKLLDFLESKHFAECPASTKYHGAFPGGLVNHSVHVYYRLFQEIDKECLVSKIGMETIAIVSLLHDICKIDNYITAEDGTIRHNPDALPMGHGEKSIYYIQKFMQLKDEEALAIRWHMGGWDYAAKGEDPDYQKASHRLLPMLLHFADMKAANIDGV